MPNNNERQIVFRLIGKDDMSAVWSRAAANAKRSGREIADAVYGPAVAPRFSGAEQMYRDTVAGRLRANRFSDVRGRFNASVHNELLSRSATAGAEDTGMFYGPAVATRFGQAQLASRLALAEETRRIRSEANVQMAESAMRRNLDVGDGRNGFAGKGFLEGGTVAGRAKEASESFYRQLKKQADGLETWGKFLKGVGAFAVAREFGQALQKIPEAADRYREMLKQGYSRGESLATAFADTVPIVGELAKGFRDVRQWIDEEVVSDRGDRRRKKEDEQERREMTAKMRGERDAKRAAAMSAAEEAARKSDLARRQVGPEGDAAARAAIYAEYDETIHGIDAGAASQFGKTEDQDKYKSLVAKQLADAKSIRDAKLAKLDRENSRSQDAADADSRRRTVDAEEEINQSKLRLQKRFLEAKLAASRQETDKEIVEAEKRYKDETTGSNAGTELSYFAKARRIAAIAAAYAKGTQREAELTAEGRDQLNEAGEAIVERYRAREEALRPTGQTGVGEGRFSYGAAAQTVTSDWQKTSADKQTKIAEETRDFMRQLLDFIKSNGRDGLRNLSVLENLKPAGL